MSDTNSTTATADGKGPINSDASQQGDPATDTQPDSGDLAAELERVRQALKNANKDAEKHRLRLKEREDRDLSELERAQREAAEFREQAQQAAVEALRFRIAAETGITEHIDLILTASDEETMRRQAELWASRTPASDTTTTAGPRPDLTQGGSGSLALNSDGLEDALKAKLGIA